MCRLVGWVSATPVTLEQVLGTAALERFSHLSSVHADGWGAGWHDDAGELHVQRSAAEARSDATFSAFAGGRASRAAIVHLRLGSPGCGYGPLSNHPFVDGPWALAHNGAIAPGDRLDLLLGEDSHRRPLGETDTERYFLALRDELDRNGGSVPAALDEVVSRMADVGVDASSLNALMLGPDALHVISWHDADWQATTIQVWPADELAAGVVPPPYFPMIYRETECSVVVASSGIMADPQGWTPIPNHAVLSIDLVARSSSITALASAAGGR